MVDPTKLPKRALIDTGVAFRAFGGFPKEAKSAACVEFLDAMVKQGHEILIAAPTITEIIRGAGKPIPRILGIEVVAFDDLAAVVIGSRLPQGDLAQLSEPNISLTHLKYDALILGCAVRHKGDCVVALDNGLHKLAKKINFPSFWPADFGAAQTMIPLFAKPPAPASSVGAATALTDGDIDEKSE
jgi:predicted nucleic acid-binding protein